MKENNHDCDCYIGNMGYSPLFRSTIIEDLKFRISQAKEFDKIKKFYGSKKPDFSFKELIEYIDTFDYCPYCGRSIDWKPISIEVNNIKVPKKYS